jgi:hypothetical protein
MPALLILNIPQAHHLTSTVDFLPCATYEYKNTK